jgi:hypothetical protein
MAHLVAVIVGRFDRDPLVANLREDVWAGRPVRANSRISEPKCAEKPVNLFDGSLLLAAHCNPVTWCLVV